MPLSPSILSYDDVRSVMDRALANGRGVKITCETIGAAYSLRQRMYNFRKLDKRENAKVYVEGEPLHNRSIYDKLTFTPIEEDEVPKLVISVRSAEALDELVEEL